MIIKYCKLQLFNVCVECCVQQMYMVGNNLECMVMCCPQHITIHWLNCSYFLLSKISPWSWPDCWLIHVGEDITMEVHNILKVHLLLVNTLCTAK